ncbi:hypothetical protein [Leptolyngbya sp. KIOST-1]|uniref:hypothetical protein n=1 Tax=Leptolyngbya sp. KIOST-1 TaxID=1229172 RepID=UPI0012DFEC31|nr:hypothetical protein [Leptolyngbya sp. KIOST-1]
MAPAQCRSHRIRGGQVIGHQVKHLGQKVAKGKQALNQDQPHRPKPPAAESASLSPGYKPVGQG